MMFLIVYVFILLLVKAHKFSEELSSRVGAEFDCNTVQYPFYTLITISSNKTSGRCGGTLVAPNFVLTAAHCCVEKNKQSYSIQTGIDRIDGNYDNKVNVTDIYIHPQYNPKEFNYDACMLKLNNQLCKKKTTDYLDLVFFNYSEFNIQTHCPRVLSASFGVLYQNEQTDNPQENPDFPKDVLQCTVLKLLGNIECSDFWKEQFYQDTMICAVDPTPRKGDVCYSDSGGPLMCENVQIGIVSFSKGCGYNNTPGVFTKVSKIQDFVLSVLKSDHLNKFRLGFSISLASRILIKSYYFAGIIFLMY